MVQEDFLHHSCLNVFSLLSNQGDLKQFLRISKNKDEKVKSQPLSTKTKVSVQNKHFDPNFPENSHLILKTASHK